MKTSLGNNGYRPQGQALSVAAIAGKASARRRLACALEAGGESVALAEPDLRLVVEALGPNGPDAIAVVSDHDNRVADISALRERDPDTPVVVVTSDGDREQMWKALRAGVDGIVTDGQLESALVATVRAACAGQLSVPRELRGQFDQPALSFREKQVLSMVVLGFTNAEIATKLYLATSTVKSHLSSAFGKLGVRSRSEAAAMILDPNNGLGIGVLAISESGLSNGGGRRARA